MATKKTVKKSVKKTPAKRATKAVAEVKPIKSKFTQTELIAKFAEKMDQPPKVVKQFFGLLQYVMQGSIHPKGLGEFTMPGMFKIVTKKIPAKKMPAIKKGTPVRNPSTGEMMPSKGRAAFTKPATVRVKVRPMAKLKKAAIGEA